MAKTKGRPAKKSVSLVPLRRSPRLNPKLASLNNSPSSNSSDSDVNDNIGADGGKLPEELIVNILACVPADVTYSVMRFICKKWYNMIKSPVFIKLNPQLTTDGLLIQNKLNNFAHFLEVRTNGDTTMNRFKYQFPGKIADSCDGLVLFWDHLSIKLFIANPVTDDRLTLPPLGLGRALGGPCLASAPVSRKFKVVQCFRSVPGGDIHPKCAIITVGVDSAWRLVDTEHLSFSGKNAFSNTGLFAGGFLYWVFLSQFVVMDVETELVWEFAFPDCLQYHNSCRQMGDCLSVVSRVSKLKWDVWKLADVRNGRWRKLYTIDLEGQVFWLRRFSFGKDDRLYPLAWMNNGEFLIFCILRSQGVHFVYNIKSGTFYSFVASEICSTSLYCKHVNSLVSWTSS